MWDFLWGSLVSDVCITVVWMCRNIHVLNILQHQLQFFKQVIMMTLMLMMILMMTIMMMLMTKMMMLKMIMMVMLKMIIMMMIMITMMRMIFIRIMKTMIMVMAMRIFGNIYSNFMILFIFAIMKCYDTFPCEE